MAVWIAFAVLGTIWGSSFLLIKIGVTELTPLQLVTLRAGTAAALILLTLVVTGRRFPSDWRSRISLIVIGTFNTALPFLLITWGQRSIDTGLASVLNSTVPLFALLVAHFALGDEHITAMKVAGLLAGFAGIVVLASRNGTGIASSLPGQAAVLGAAACSGAATVFVRRNLRHLSPVVVCGGTMLTSTVLVGIITLFTDGLPNFAALSGRVVVAVAALGLMNTYVAYILYYWIIGKWGVTRAAMVTYLLPPIGLTLGAILLNETVDGRLLIGAALIIAGVALVNLHLRRPVSAVKEPAVPVIETQPIHDGQHALAGLVADRK